MLQPICWRARSGNHGAGAIPELSEELRLERGDLGLIAAIDGCRERPVATSATIRPLAHRTGSPGGEAAPTLCRGTGSSAHRAAAAATGRARSQSACPAFPHHPPRAPRPGNRRAQPRGTRQCLDRGGGVGSNPGRHLANNQRRIGSDRGRACRSSSARSNPPRSQVPPRHSLRTCR